MLAFSDACERNKEPILACLRSSFAARRSVLEIGSGTGQHAVYFAAHLPHLTWLPTERLEQLAALQERVALEGGGNLLVPELLDVAEAKWPPRSIDAVFTANTLHIMCWEEVVSLFIGAAQGLAAGGTLCIYGPFRYQGRYTSASNREFDAMLRARDSRSGLRDLDALLPLADGQGFALLADHDLPAYNRLLVFVRDEARSACQGVRH